MFEIEVDLAICQGHAQCVMAAPEYFDLHSETGQAVALGAAPDDDALPTITEAAQACPVRAIQIKPAAAIERRATK